MKRNRYIVLPVAVLAWGIAALATGSAGLGLLGSSSTTRTATTKAGVSTPACLPATIDHSARLAGTDVDVSPEPESATANPDTQISFLNTGPANIRKVSVVGSKSGRHAGSLRAYSQGDGASFVPKEPFQAGETVSVTAVIGARRAGRSVSFGFHVDTPYPTAAVPEFGNPRAAPADYQSFDTMPGVQAPVLTVTAPDRDPAAGEIFTTNGPGPGQYGPLIYTPQGQLVWFDKLPAGETAEDLNVQSYDGRRELTWWRGRVLSLGFGQGEDIVMNSSYQTVATVHGGNGLHADLHEFQIEPHDVAFLTAFNPIRCDLSSAEGPRNGAIIDTAIQEIDMQTGLVRWEWHSLDHVRVGESETSPPASTPWDWFHLNSIDLEADGDVFISARSTWAGYQLEGGSGRILWRLGGSNSSFKMGPGTKTAWQHDGRILADGEVTFFDDGSNPPVHSESRAIRIALDFATHEARLVKAFTHDPPVLSSSQGNAQTLASGNTVVEFGGVPEMSEYAPDGSLLFDAHLPYDMASYRGYRYAWSGRPRSSPAVLATLNNTSEETIVHMSWNGATEVASWRVLAGQHEASLAARARSVPTGFETSIMLAKKYQYVEVQALASDGRVLGVSQTTSIRPYSASLASG
ncbi:MAG: arylsulfotransferase family protein [Solirubrobacteraceae bacterium]